MTTQHNMHTKLFAGICLAAISLVATAGQIMATNGSSETPTTDFITNNDSVTDTKTGLVWQRCLVGQSFDGMKCTGQAQVITNFEEALATSSNGWRLPTIKELSSLSDHNMAQPALNTEVHKFASGIDLEEKTALWSSTPKPTPKSNWGEPTFNSYVFNINTGMPTYAKRIDGTSYYATAKYVLLVKSQ